MRGRNEAADSVALVMIGLALVIQILFIASIVSGGVVPGVKASANDHAMPATFSKDVLFGGAAFGRPRPCGTGKSGRSTSCRESSRTWMAAGGAAVDAGVPLGGVPGHEIDVAFTNGKA